MKRLFIIWFIAFGGYLHAQNTSNNFRSKKIIVNKDSIKVDSISINPIAFKVYDTNKRLLDASEYQIDFSTATLIIDKNKFKEVEVEYYCYPEFLTKSYYKFDKKLIVPFATPETKLYRYNDNRTKKLFEPFDGLQTSGSISRGLTVGNNQDAVVNSTLDLQIAGKLSEEVTLRASITDSNIPIQENGYTQQSSEFDRVFIELFTKDWSIKAGDVILEDTESYFGQFSKKISGISIDGTINHKNSKTEVFGSGALVRGKFTNYQFTGQESNQGPYKLLGPNEEQFIIILSGSETVYVNGIPLQRGENFDYIIDYNTAEVTFMPTFPINANMRISIDFQYSDQKYTRFVTHNGVQYKSNKLKVGGSYYLETDAKNQPLQQDLTDDQQEILTNAGNDTSKMISPSAVEVPYSENQIQYKKEIVGNIETFVYSNDENDTLYNVTFSNVGAGNGSYQFQTTIAIGKIYEYVGQNQGDFAPVIQLDAPNKLQLAITNASYNPNEKTLLNGEIALSQNDQNLFSEIDNEQNNGLAAKLGWLQTIIDKKWDLKSSVNYESISENFTTIQRFRNIEFNRDWNIENPEGDQQMMNAMLSYENEQNGGIAYNIETLMFNDTFKGIRHNLMSNLHFDKLRIDIQSSLLNSDSEVEETAFFRLNSTTQYNFNKSWIGAKVNSEDNEQKDIATQQLSALSQRFIEYEGYFGVGDSTGVFAEIGYNHRINDSLKLNSLENVSTAKTIYVNSQLIQAKNSRLSIYANYRDVNNVDFENNQALNSRFIYNQQFFKRILGFNLVYETNSGNIAQQEFAYVEVEPGQGYYTWIDYNGNGIKEINEFEIAKFPDEATYLRVALPTQNFIKTSDAKLSNSINLNFQQWSNQNGLKKIISHFQNQAFAIIDNKQERIDETFNLNPFETKNLIGLNSSFKNSLFFNRGRQKFSTSYNILTSDVKSSLAVDEIETKIQLHQLQFIHKFGVSWLMDLSGTSGINSSTSLNFSNRNYKVASNSVQPKLTYLYSNTTSLDFIYQYKEKENTIANFETLFSHKIGTAFKASNNKNMSITADFNFYINDFEGDQNSSVAYQMLEGLQPGENITWSLLWQQKLTTFLDLNISYLGRKSEETIAIHTGSVQLRANF